MHLHSFNNNLILKKLSLVNCAFYFRQYCIKPVLCNTFSSYRVFSSLPKEEECFKIKLNFLNNKNGVKFTESNQELMNKKIKKLEENGITVNDILANPEILESSPGDIKYYIKLLKEVNVEKDALVSMLTCSPDILHKFYNTCKRDLKTFPEHRLQHLSNVLDVPQKQLSSYLPKYQFLLIVSFNNLRDVLKVLLSHKVQPKDILSDPWILRCKAEAVESRLAIVEEAEVDVIKPWMARCPDHVFQGFLQRVSTEQKLLGNLSLEEYLSKRLDCSVFEIKEIIDREPQLQKTSILKMKRILDFLISSGFSTSQIMAGLPRVANRRIETIHARLMELNHVGISPSLYVLCKSKREYHDYVNKRKGRDK